MNDSKPTISLRPTDLWRFRKDPHEWLQEERKVLLSSARREIRKALPEPERWEKLRPKEQQKLCDAIFSRLVERSGGTAEFVQKLLPSSMEAFLLDTLEEARTQEAAATREVSTEDALEAARAVLHAFSEKVTLERWNALSRAEQERQLAKLLGLIAHQLKIEEVAEIPTLLETPLDVLLHQEYQRMDTQPGARRNA